MHVNRSSPSRGEESEFYSDIISIFVVEEQVSRRKQRHRVLSDNTRRSGKKLRRGTVERGKYNKPILTVNKLGAPESLSRLR